MRSHNADTRRLREGLSPLAATVVLGVERGTAYGAFRLSVACTDLPRTSPSFRLALKDTSVTTAV